MGSPRNRKLRENAARLQGGKCYWCGVQMTRLEPPYVMPGESLSATDATLEHLIPKARGGGLYDPTNCVAACHSCNNARGDAHWTGPVAKPRQEAHG